MQHLPAPIHHARDAAQLPVAIDYPAALALRQMSMVHDELPKYRKRQRSTVLTLIYW
ncbi:TPA: hypothetical protein L6726_004584 [Escherichia coli]|nr:hypothetical protein [Escherichia coli]GCG26620.1 resolvase ResA [Escherichia coli]GCG53530.1 resolvase ResA [Escherichia coli]GCH01332.1 resolvase ResA [Escherichia coli]HBP8983843.1 hypothetical protein [Escherichia coli]